MIHDTNASDRLGGVLSEVLELPAADIHDDLAMKDLDAWDSLKHMELIVALESAFEVELTFDEIVTMTTVAAIRRVLAEKGAAS